jgi:hypothetical protein
MIKDKGRSKRCSPTPSRSQINVDVFRSATPPRPLIEHPHALLDARPVRNGALKHRAWLRVQNAAAAPVALAMLSAIRRASSWVSGPCRLLSPLGVALQLFQRSPPQI